MVTTTPALTSARTPPSASTSTGTAASGVFDPSDVFEPRHIGPNGREVDAMLNALGCKSMEELIAATVPSEIRLRRPLVLEAALTETAAVEKLRQIMRTNRVARSMIGCGYHDCITPPTVQRNILENPSWYTQYTPYQAEISQGRLEALLNFQTMIADLTALPLAGASLLDEATAAAEAMAMCIAISGKAPGDSAFFVDEACHPQTIAVVQTRATAIGATAVVGSVDSFAAPEGKMLVGVLVQYPATDGRIRPLRVLAESVHAANAKLVVACDLLALSLIEPPGEAGADIAVGSAQRFGVPMGFGGPHAGFISTRSEHARRIPGRIIGVSKDALGRVAYRMAIQTREQHIRRERATSNICTAQALLAIMAGMYAVHHGPEGITRIAKRVRAFARVAARALRTAGHEILTPDPLFDTLRVRPRAGSADVFAAALSRNINLRNYGDGTFGITTDETTSRDDVMAVLQAFGVTMTHSQLDASLLGDDTDLGALARTTPFLVHDVFRSHRSETQLLRYIKKLEGRDLSLANSMIPLGSCTMKLNATSEMIPVTWEESGRLHPFAPADQTAGYRKVFADLETWLSEVTGFSSVSLMPNAGSQGEFAGLLVIRAYHESRKDMTRNVCLIPDSAHGTNPASAAVAGFRVVAVKCDARGNIDLPDLEAKAKEHQSQLGALMVTYPSTHGVFEGGIRDVCEIVHRYGGQVYMDGANMNAQVGLCRPGDIGADVCHLNLHKTFCIPHGGGGPGMGPIAVAKHLTPFLPTHPVAAPDSAGATAIGAISAAPYGSPSILLISWAYIAMMGPDGLKRATEVAILNANYMAHRLGGHYPILYAGESGRVAHEFIIDCRSFESSGVKVEDIAKRLMDYGFHAPTVAFPVPGTLMIEPTESESRAELDRLCDALIEIRREIREIEEGRADRENNVLRNAPHTIERLTGEWNHPYTRDAAAFPLPYLRESKFWASVSRIDNPFGDRNLVCTCPPMSEYTD